MTAFPQVANGRHPTLMDYPRLIDVDAVTTQIQVARRLGVPGDDHDPRPRALVAAALGCLNVAVDVWTAADGAIPLADLVDQAMAAVGG